MPQLALVGLVRIVRQHRIDMTADIRRELRINLVQYTLAIEQRPHLANGFIADTGHDPADGIEHGIGGATLVPPVLLCARQRRQVPDALPVDIDLASIADGIQILPAGPDHFSLNE